MYSWKLYCQVYSNVEIVTFNIICLQTDKKKNNADTQTIFQEKWISSKDRVWKVNNNIFRDFLPDKLLICWK